MGISSDDGGEILCRMQFKELDANGDGEARKSGSDMTCDDSNGMLEYDAICTSIMISPHGS